MSRLGMIACNRPPLAVIRRLVEVEPGIWSGLDPATMTEIEEGVWSV